MIWSFLRLVRYVSDLGSSAGRHLIRYTLTNGAWNSRTSHSHFDDKVALITLNGNQFGYLLSKRFEFRTNFSRKYPNWSLKRRFWLVCHSFMAWLNWLTELVDWWSVINDELVLIYGISYTGNTFILHRIQPLGYRHIFILKTYMYVINLKDIKSAKWVFQCDTTIKNPTVWTSGSPHVASW